MAVHEACCRRREASKGSGSRAPLLGLFLPFIVGACASVPLEQKGALSYQHLAPSDGLLTKAQVSVNKDEVLAAGTIRIMPTTFSATATEARLSDVQLRLIANAVDRSLCGGLSDRFQIIPAAKPADLTVRAVITRIIPTDETAAAASKVTEVAAAVATAVHVVLMPSFRIPIGLGGLALEAEAVDQSGTQHAAILWARGADSFTSKARVSRVGDAYDLASAFSDDFSKLLVTGATPFGTLPSPPSVHRVVSLLGGAPKDSACEVFGRGPGIPGLFGSAIGLPPEWTDRGAPTDD